MDIAAALASLNSALGILKGLREIDKAYDLALLRAQVVDLMGNVTDAKAELLEAQETLTAKDKEIARLSDALAEKGELVDGPGGYKWPKTEDGLRRGFPICPACDEKEHRQVLLKQVGRGYGAVCPRCATKFDPVEYFHEPTNGQEKTRTQADQEQRDADNRAATAAIGRYAWDRV